jgi:chromosome segregation ATPase
MNLIEIASKTAGCKQINNHNMNYSTWVFCLDQLQALVDAISKEKDAEIERLNSVRYRWDAAKCQIAELEREIERLNDVRYRWEAAKCQIAELEREIERLKEVDVDLQAELLVTKYAIDDEKTMLNAKVVMLSNALKECLEDSRDVLDKYLQKYGENFKPHRIEAQRKIIAEAVQAISATEQDATPVLNSVKSNSIEAILRGDGTLTDHGIFTYGKRMQLKGEPV